LGSVYIRRVALGDVLQEVPGAMGTVLPIDVFLVLGFGALAIMAGILLHRRSALLRRCLISPPIIAASTLVGRQDLMRI
jgi:hypothetical protein